MPKGFGEKVRYRINREEDRAAADAYFNKVKKAKEGKGLAFAVRDVRISGQDYIELVVLDKAQLPDAAEQGYKEYGKEA